MTAFGQTYLPDALRSLANSSGSWTLAAFGLAVLAPSSRSGALTGFIALASMLAGYVVTNNLRDYPSSLAMMIFWTVAAVAVGPLIGLGAQWFRRRRDLWAAAGLGAMSAVLIGEGIYSLIYVADTTYPAYWWGEMVLGVAGLAAGALWQLPSWRIRAAAVGVAAIGSAGFVLTYSLPLIALL